MRVLNARNHGMKVAVVQVHKTPSSSASHAPMMFADALAATPESKKIQDASIWNVYGAERFFAGVV